MGCEIRACEGFAGSVSLVAEHVMGSDSAPWRPASFLSSQNALQFIKQYWKMHGRPLFLVLIREDNIRSVRERSEGTSPAATSTVHLGKQGLPACLRSSPAGRVLRVCKGHLVLDG